MRRALFAGCLLAMLPSASSADPTPYLATVADAEVLVRAGPSDKFPDTGTLKRGARLVVDHEEFGWLAIQAPPGSISWVPIAFVDFDPNRPIPQNVSVSDDVTLASGKIGLAQPLTEIRKTKLPAGSALTVIGQKVIFDNKQWYPVEPIQGDFRYVPKTAVQGSVPANAAFVVRDTIPPGVTPANGTTPTYGNGGSEGGPLGSGAKTPVVNDPLWTQAEAAERNGRSDDAEKLYFQLARKMNEPGGDHDIANLCYTRIHALREKKRTSGTVGLTAPVPLSAPVAVPTKSSPQRSDRPTLLPPVKNDAPMASTPTIVSTLPSPAASSGDKAAWTGTGRLVSSPLALDGRQTYALETAPGVTQLYVVAGEGFNLEQYKKHTVKLYGTTHTHANAKKPYLVATDALEVNQ